MKLKSRSVMMLSTNTPKGNSKVGHEALGHGILVTTGTPSSGHSEPRDVLSLCSVRSMKCPWSSATDGKNHVYWAIV